MFPLKPKHLLLFIAIPIIFRVLESVNGPWPIPFQWPEISGDVDYDTRKRLYVEPDSVRRREWKYPEELDPTSLCKYTRDCLPKEVKFPMKIAIAPKVGLSACIVGGILAQELEALLCYLERDGAIGNVKQFTAAEIDRFCGATNKFNSVLEMSKNIRVRLRDMRKWTFVMLTRGPLDRFIQGFIKHCIQKQDTCYGCGNDVACFADAYHLRLQQFAMYNEENYRSISDMDWDLFPQTWMCDVEQWREKYTFIPYSSNLINVVGNLTQILGNKHLSTVDRILRESSWQQRNLESFLFLDLKRTVLNSAKLKSLIVKMYHNDFRVLGYKIAA